MGGEITQEMINEAILLSIKSYSVRAILSLLTVGVAIFYNKNCEWKKKNLIIAGAVGFIFPVISAIWYFIQYISRKNYTVCRRCNLVFDRSLKCCPNCKDFRFGDPYSSK